MDQTRQPSKEQVRQWLINRIGRRNPIPNIQQIRDELGWGKTKQACLAPSKVTAPCGCVINEIDY